MGDAPRCNAAKVILNHEEAGLTVQLIATRIGASMEARAVAQALVSAINAHDLTALLGTLTLNHRLIDSLGGVVTSREALEAAWTAYFAMVPDYRIEVHEWFTWGPVVLALGRARGSLVWAGVPRPELTWSCPAAWRAEVRGGRVAEWRVYADNEPIRERIRQAAV